MRNLLRWLRNPFRKKELWTEILCVHGKLAFQRNEIASRLFRERLARTKNGAIVCNPSDIVPVLFSLGVEIPDGMKWWSSIRKLEFAEKRLAVELSGVKILLNTRDIATQLVWINGGSLVQGYTPTGCLIFTGSINDDPFVKLDRTTFIPGAEGGRAYHTNAGEYCSSWHC